MDHRSLEHIAIMRKSWGLTAKILSGQKNIESRWYSVKCKPWDGIREREVVYFKDSGEPVKIKTEVDKVLQFADLTPKKVQDIINEYRGGIGIKKEEVAEFLERFKNKKYCMLIFLKNPVVVRPFEINKTGFGIMSAWISVCDVSMIEK